MDRGTNSFVGGGPFFCDYGTGNRLLQRPITYSIMEMKNLARMQKKIAECWKNVGFFAFALYQA